MNLRSGLVAAALAVVGAAASANAQLAANWYTIDWGGRTSSWGTFVVSGTIGQPDAGPVTSEGVFTVAGGFWAGVNGSAHGRGSADFNCDGIVGTDQDILAFFSCLSGNCPPAPCTSSSDFNGDVNFGTDQDTEAFFRELSGGNR